MFLVVFLFIVYFFFFPLLFASQPQRQPIFRIGSFSPSLPPIASLDGAFSSTIPLLVKSSSKKKYDAPFGFEKAIWGEGGGREKMGWLGRLSSSS